MVLTGCLRRDMTLGFAPGCRGETVGGMGEDTVLMVEQDVKHSLSLSDRGYVLEHGRVAMEGRAVDLIDAPHVKEAYLGL
jgi:ABC-type branched-subunit amino acid transport system ATPase component